MNLWTSKDAVKATNGISKINWVADGISIDTRNIKPGDLFVALKDKRDGHEFVKLRLKKGPQLLSFQKSRMELMKTFRF